MSIRTVVALVLALALSVLSGCGGSDADPAPAVHTAPNGDVHNDADIEFATEAVPHLAETVEYVVLTDDRPLGDEARAIADGIRESRVLDVEQLITWLTAWEQPIPETSLDHANAGHDRETGASSEALDALRSASDDEFEELWLAALATQIEEGIGLARAEQDDGRFDGAVELATTMEETQAADVAALRDLLG